MSLETQIKEHFDTLQRDFTLFKKTNDDRLEALEKKGHAPADLVEKITKINDGLDSINDEIKALKTAKNRSDAANEETSDTFKAECKDIMSRWMRKGRVPTSEEQAKLNKHLINEYKVTTLTEQSDPDGGYLVRPEIAAEMVEKQVETSPMRQLASVQTISGPSLTINLTWGRPSASWAGELSTRSQTAPAALKQVEIPAREMYAEPAASQALLDDASVDIERWHAEQVALAFNETEATAFIAGTGVGQPQGITNYTSGDDFNKLEQVVSGNASTLTANGLIALQNALYEVFQAGAVFLMRRATALVCRQLVDGQGRYLWGEGLNGDQSSTLLGKPVYFAADMPAVSAGNLAVAYGNFKQGYQIVDRVGIRVLRDPFTTKGSVLFYTTKRVGGGVKHFQAIKIHKVSA